MTAPVMVRLVLGGTLMISGLAAGLYAGLWWALVGGIVDIIGVIQADYVDTARLVFGILKVMLSSLIGWAAAFALILPGYFVLARPHAT
ncbi:MULTISPECIES: hypothetical protein [unclassified Thioalkalivibrio]|uniref:hypothetical protein n=1 Tax=unclassified Thioalkalivibrio TaxID=2621013 RepID=UPI00037F5370|nr:MULTISPECIES: hypothetical protein [unclassified Thioalkalivibrio]